MSTKDITFAAAYEELQKLTQEFESNNLDLEQAIPKFKRAAELSKFLKQKLSELENQIEEISLDLEKETETLMTTQTSTDDIPF